MDQSASALSTTIVRFLGGEEMLGSFRSVAVNLSIGMLRGIRHSPRASPAANVENRFGMKVLRQGRCCQTAIERQEPDLVLNVCQLSQKKKRCLAFESISRAADRVDFARSI